MMFYTLRKISLLSVSLFIGILSTINSFAADNIPEGDWQAYARTHEGTRFSPLTQITKSNVSKLKRAWTIQTGDCLDEGCVFECTPLVIGSRMYVLTPFARVLALDAVTGKRLWEFDHGFPRKEMASYAHRGVSYWKDGDKERIFVPVRNGRLYSLDAETGKPDPSFGDGGVVNFRKFMGKAERFISFSSPPAIYKDIVIQGFLMPDGYTKGITHAPLVAINAHTGKEVWRFNTIPQGNEPGTETWKDESWRGRGGGNVWSIMSVDEERGMVFLPVSTPHFDFYGGDRLGDNLFTDSVVALDAQTGKKMWHFQTVHHDLWDYDLPSQPNLMELNIDGKKVSAVTQTTKTGYVYVLHRETGKPLFPIEELPVPASDVPGEQASSTQPIPLKPPSFTTQGLSEENLSRLDEETYQYLLKKFRTLRSEGPFTPPSFRGTITFPGFHGGANWSGAAVSPDGMMYINSTELACYVALEKNPDDPNVYKHTGWHRFRDQNGYPGNAPPWGQLSKIDLNKGEIVWQKPLGEFEELTARGIPITGQENFGGATITANGLVIIASTMDEHIRIFDADTGAVLWKHKLDAGGYAAPVTYLGKDGKQYIAICAGGGGKIATKNGDYVIAFRLESLID